VRVVGDFMIISDLYNMHSTFSIKIACNEYFLSLSEKRRVSLDNDNGNDD
jgi:hypothetical protein